MVSDPISLTVGNVAVSGWQRVQCTLGLDLMPNTFLVEATEFYPTPGPTSALASVVILEGQACQLKIGSDLVLTGYVATVEREMAADRHLVRVTGASKSTDLVDCSAEFSTFQINNTSPLKLIS